MSFSFFAATLYHTSLVPFILSSGRSGGPFSLLKNLYLWRTKKGEKGKQWGQTISFLPGVTHLLFRALSVRGDLHHWKSDSDRLKRMHIHQMNPPPPLNSDWRISTSRQGPQLPQLQYFPLFWEALFSSPFWKAVGVLHRNTVLTGAVPQVCMSWKPTAWSAIVEGLLPLACLLLSLMCVGCNAIVLLITKGPLFAFD